MKGEGGRDKEGNGLQTKMVSMTVLALKDYWFQGSLGSSFEVVINEGFRRRCSEGRRGTRRWRAGLLITDRFKEKWKKMERGKNLRGESKGENS